MSFKKNFRGAETYAMPANEKYRDNYDRIFGKKDDVCEHDWAPVQNEDAYRCQKCGFEEPRMAKV